MRSISGKSGTTISIFEITPQFVEKLRYIYRNPVKAGLCERPEDWQWSSFRHYATGCEGRVEDRVGVDRAKTRTRCGKTFSGARTGPLKPKPGLSRPSTTTRLPKSFCHQSVCL